MQQEQGFTLKAPGFGIMKSRQIGREAVRSRLTFVQEQAEKTSNREAAIVEAWFVEA